MNDDYKEFDDIFAKHRVQPAGLVGKGWWPILDRLMGRLIELGWNRELAQVKEKYGGLRFYIYGVDEKIYDAVYEAIDDAEAEAARTCEWCGTPGKCSSWDAGWMLTLCDKCGEERREEGKKWRIK
jgi:hypothetical protein